MFYDKFKIEEKSNVSDQWLPWKFSIYILFACPNWFGI